MAAVGVWLLTRHGHRELASAGEPSNAFLTADYWVLDDMKSSARSDTTALMVDTEGGQRVRPVDRRGATVLSLFALLWAAAGTSALPSPAAWIALGAAALMTLLLIVGGRRRPTSGIEPAPGWERRFFQVGMLQGVAIAISVGVLAALDRSELIPPAVCVIVGLHLIPLASLFEQPLYRWTAAALCVVAAAGFVAAVLSGAVGAQGVVGIGAAVTLYATALLLIGPRHRVAG